MQVDFSTKNPDCFVGVFYHKSERLDIASVFKQDIIQVV
jgi:hypothetical protein